MQRKTVTIDDELLDVVDTIIAGRGYQNRSEAIRDLTRAGIAKLDKHSPDHQGPLPSFMSTTTKAARSPGG